MFRLYCIPWKNCHMSNSNVNSLLIIKVAELADVIKFILAKNQEEILHSIAWAVKITNKWHLSDDQNSQKNCNIQTFGDWCLIGQKRDCHGKITDVLFVPSWSILNKGTIWTIISDVILPCKSDVDPLFPSFPLTSIWEKWEVMLRLQN